MTAPISVLIVDDHPISRLGIERALETDSGIRVLGTFATWPEARASEPADVTILDLFLVADVPCLGLIAQLAPSRPVLVASASHRYADIEACWLSGARGYVYKGSTADMFVNAVRTLYAGRTVFPEAAPPAPTASKANGISPREQQVLAYIASGYTHDQIASRLGISRNTVDTHAKRLRHKLGAHNKAQLTRIALAEAGALYGGRL